MITETMLTQLRSLIRPLKTRIANSIATAVIENVDDSTKMQVLQLIVLSGETLDDCLRFQEYGFNSVPLTGAEAVVVFPNGDRGNPLVVAVDDRRHRPTDWDPGDAGVYNSSLAQVRLKGADIEVNPGPGGKVFVRTSGGSSEPVVLLSEHNSHSHPAPLGPTGTPTTDAVGTTKSEYE